MIPPRTSPAISIHKIEHVSGSNCYLELDGNPSELDRAWGNGPVWNPSLALDGQNLAAVKNVDASSGRVGFRTDDNAVHVVHWKTVGHIVQIRVGDTLLSVNLTHIDKPASPEAMAGKGVE
jgi:hypothetical protein